MPTPEEMVPFRDMIRDLDVFLHRHVVAKNLWTSFRSAFFMAAAGLLASLGSAAFLIFGPEVAEGSASLLATSFAVGGFLLVAGFSIMAYTALLLSGLWQRYVVFES